MASLRRGWKRAAYVVSRYVLGFAHCQDCGKELSDEDLYSTDPTRCDSCKRAS